MLPARVVANERSESAVESHTPSGGWADDVSSCMGTSTQVRDREQCFLESSAIRSATRINYHETVETFRLWESRSGIPPETVPELDHECAGISKGMKEIPRAGVSRLAWSQPGEKSRFSPVILLINEMTRLGTLASRPKRRLRLFALYRSEALRLCQDQCEWQANPWFWSILLHPQEWGMSPKVDV